MSTVNFKDLPNGTKFEQLIRELIHREGYDDITWTGQGPDGGRDLLFSENLVGSLSQCNRRWVVSCKHNAHSGKSVGISDIDGIIDSCKSVKAGGFILACSTHPSAAVVTRLKEIQENNEIITKIWDGVHLTNKLISPNCYSLLNIFFPSCELNKKWSIYNSNSPSFWAANYKGYFFYMSSRKANTFPPFEVVDEIINRFEGVSLPEISNNFSKHKLRLRAVYYDDKHTQFTAYLDYIFPNKDIPFLVFEKDVNFIQPDELQEQLGYGIVSGELSIPVRWDVVYVTDNQASDSYFDDAKKYYSSCMRDFEAGFMRHDNLLS